MQISGFPFGTTDWEFIEPTEHKGETAPPTGKPKPLVQFESVLQNIQLAT